MNHRTVRAGRLALPWAGATARAGSAPAPSRAHRGCPERVGQALPPNALQRRGAELAARAVGKLGELCLSPASHGSWGQCCKGTGHGCRAGGARGALQHGLHRTSKLWGVKGMEEQNPSHFWVWPPSLTALCLFKLEKQRHHRPPCERGSSSPGQPGSPTHRGGIAISF